MKENLLIITGPTAVGKTNSSIKLAKDLNGEIISADSMQIYKYMDIGTAKIQREEMQGIKHHLVDIIYPDEDFTVSDYKNKATSIISNINRDTRLPIVVGGTGLYINSLVYKLNFATVPPNEVLREKYENLANEYGNKYIHEQLSKVDKESGKKIHVRDRRRIIRALEVYHTSGITMSQYSKDFRQESDEYNLAMICLNMNRAKLYDKINSRVDQMMDKGLIQEVKDILEMGYNKDLVSLQGIGYKEIIMYLDGYINLNEAVEKIKQGSRNYAKRQLTWFRRDKRIQFIDIDYFNDSNELVTNIKTYINNHMYL